VTGAAVVVVTGAAVVVVTGAAVVVVVPQPAIEVVVVSACDPIAGKAMRLKVTTVTAASADRKPVKN
jgi:hypothetical protein